MTLSDLAAIGSFVSGIAVLLSFIFLALQIRQNARNQRATIHNERTALVQQLMISTSDAELVELRSRGNAADQTLDAKQSWRYLGLALATLRLLEEFFDQHRDGMIDEARWEANELRVCSFLQAPGFRAAWRALSATFRSDFVAWMDELMRKTPVATNQNDAVLIWKDFAAQEMAQIQVT